MVDLVVNSVSGMLDEQTHVDVLTSMMVSSIGKPLGPVIVDVRVPEVVYAPVRGSVVVVIMPAEV